MTSHAKQPIQEDFVSLDLFGSDLPIIVRGWRRVECLGTIGDVRVESFDEEEHERLFVKSSLMSDDFEFSDIFFDRSSTLLDGLEFGLSVDLFVFVRKLDRQHIDEVLDIGPVILVCSIFVFDGEVETIDPGVDFGSLDKVEHPYDLDLIIGEVVGLEDEPVLTFPDERLVLFLGSIERGRHGGFESHLASGTMSSWSRVVAISGSSRSSRSATWTVVRSVRRWIERRS